MPPVHVDPARIKSFRSAAAFNTWLSKQHLKAEELWIRIFKKDSGIPTITYAEALDVVLCWGWIDGIKKSYDEVSFLQRYTPRRAKSVWSQVNREHVARLIKEGRMTEHGLKQVDAAKQDGRWDAAYAPIRSASVAGIPDDLRAAIKKNAKAERTFATLNKMNLFALAYRTNAMRTPAGRAKKIAALVAMLAKGETITPLPKSRPAARPAARAAKKK
ncbi:MAG TPA: YdeI/OmpD-associated family protein [Gemmatimonadaceae bacterium]|nr:YdeI/OmpD-associated family protein [Gemmatimonadaceae bacterium]HRQ77539.1 YdeI/OmpD-associated family protein [Gemmatimonadaceae bacterium]